MGFEKLLNQKRLILVLGLGGVGKTTLSAALALQAAVIGKKSLVITVDPARRLAAILNIKTATPVPKKIWQDKEGKGELWACLLDAKHTFDQLIGDHAPKNLKETILANPLYQQLSMMLAGTQEYMAMEKLFSLSKDQKWDLVVVDTPPARHAIDFLEAPAKMSNMLNDSILKFLIAPSLKIGGIGGKMLGALGHLTGDGVLGDIAQLMNLSISLLDGFSQRSSAIMDLLKDKQSAFLLATSMHAATVSDAIHFRQQLASMGYALEGLLINRMPPFVEKLDPKTIAWGKNQKEKIWQYAAHIAEEQLALYKHLRKKLKPLLEQIPHVAWIIEKPEGISNFEDLKSIC